MTTRPDSRLFLVVGSRVTASEEVVAALAAAHRPDRLLVRHPPHDMTKELPCAAS